MKTLSIQKLATERGVAFGTSGVRGLVEAMSAEVCAAYVRAFLQTLEGQSVQRVVLGIDLRPSSPDIARACIFALETAGYEVEYCGVLPTPALAFYALQEKLAAIMVTGSHIPFDRNGIKFYRLDGEISKQDEAFISSASVHLPTEFVLPPLPSVNESAQQCYLDRYMRFFPAQMLAGKRIGFYQHSSVARDLLTTLLERLGAQVIALGRTDQFVPIDTEAVSEEDAERAKLWVKEHRLDALISTDGDADRPLIGDEQGHWFRGDVVGLLCAKFLHAQALAVPVSCTTAIEKSAWFSQVLRTRIGSPYVIEGMAALTGAVVGFEANGGFLLASEIARDGSVLAPLPTRDAVLPILALLALAQENKQALSELTAQLPPRFTASDRLQNFAKTRSQSLLENLIQDPEPLVCLYGPVVNVNQTDGLRFTFKNGDIIHLRPSGNAPELRCYAESDEAQKAKQLVAEVLALVADL